MIALLLSYGADRHMEGGGENLKPCAFLELQDMNHHKRVAEAKRLAAAASIIASGGTCQEQKPEQAVKPFKKHETVLTAYLSTDISLATWSALTNLAGYENKVDIHPVSFHSIVRKGL